MNDKTTNPTAFHLVGRYAAGGLDDISGLNLKPALYANFTNMDKLRYDFPVVLGHYDNANGFVRSLSDIVNDAIKQMVPSDVEGEFMRSQFLNLEQEIRMIARSGTSISLTEAWGTAVHNLRARASNGSLEPLEECVEKIRESFSFDGQIVDCNAAMPMALVRQAWAIDQREKSHISRKKVDEIILGLEHILGAAVKKSEETLSPENLRMSIGSSFESAFDFATMSSILMPANSREPLPMDRHQRINSALHVLQSQKFFKSARWSNKKTRRVGPYSFLFKNTASALRAIQIHVPDMVDLIRAISIAELEISNRYEPLKHDAYFAAFDESSLVPEDLAFFPTYLIGLTGSDHDAAERARILELLSSGMPVKIMAQVDDILGGLTGSDGHLPLGGTCWQFANMAVGLNNVFVMQSSSANLYRMRNKIWDGLTFQGPSLFSVFSGEKEGDQALSSYLVSAAATESRAFPTFTYDPSKGPDWASRLSIGANPQLEKDWPIHNFSYEDKELQRLSEEIAFTFIEFVGSDKRFTRFFARVPRAEWTASMMSVTKYLDLATAKTAEAVPYVLMFDENHMLYRLVVDDRLIRTARRYRDMWHSLQEMGGIHSSHALYILTRERERWQAEKDLELAELGNLPVSEVAPTEEDSTSVDLKTPDLPDEVLEVSSDEPFIETLRCTTCNECTEINSQMFAYNDNMQAYIADLSRGTYRQLVEAAENCQVSIIHPGKPKDSKEPNLDELVERAGLFA